MGWQKSIGMRLGPGLDFYDALREQGTILVLVSNTGAFRLWRSLTTVYV